MLSSEEYAKITEQLDNIPSSIDKQQQQNLQKTLQKKLKEHYYASNYPPFEALPYELIFVNRTTTERTLNRLIHAVNNSTSFTLDTESVRIPFKPNKPVLIQLQIITSESFSLLVLIEACHLPSPDQIQFLLIKQIFNLLFQPNKYIYIWGEINELKPFTQYQLFTETQIKLSNNINVQLRFRQYWLFHHPHRTQSPTTNTQCQCEICLGIRPGNLWSIQTAVAVELHRWLDKRFTCKSFNIGLDPKLYRLNDKQLEFRQQMCNYAAYDCDAIYQLIISTKIIDEQYQSLQHTHVINSSPVTHEQIAKFKPILELEPVSDDEDEIFLSTLTSINQIINVTEPIEKPQSTAPEPLSTTRINTDHERRAQPTQLSQEERKRIHNRTCTIRQRRRSYKHEIIIRNIDHRFTIRKIKQLLKEHSIEFSAINTSISTSNRKSLYIGIKKSDQLNIYKERTQYLFTRNSYNHLYHSRNRSYSNIRR